MSDSSKRLKIAVVGPLTGSRSDYGDLIRKACEIARNSTEIEYLYFDDEANPHKAIQCAKEIIKNNASIVVGHLSSFCADVAAPLYQKHDIPLILPAATKMELVRFNNVFRVCPNENKMFIAMEDLLTKLKKYSVAYYVDNSQYGTYLENKLQKVLDGLPCVDSPECVSNNKSLHSIILLGVHHRMANFINSLGSIKKKLKLYCCDEAAIDNFSSLILSEHHEIQVFSQLGGYMQSSIISVQIAEEILLENNTTKPLMRLKTLSRFNSDGEYLEANCTLQPL